MLGRIKTENDYNSSNVAFLASDNEEVRDILYYMYLTKEFSVALW